VDGTRREGRGAATRGLEKATLAGGCFWGVEEILDYFFRLHDPTTVDRQGEDAGTQYRSAIFYHSDRQRRAAIRAIERAGKSGRWGGRRITTRSPTLPSSMRLYSHVIPMV
jgi:peptide methionine sulfoxide reductase MsrA